MSSLRISSSNYTQPQNLFSAIQSRSIGNIKQVTQVVQERLKRNISEGNSEKTIFNGHTNRFHFYVHGNTTITCGFDGTINCLDFRTGKQTWEHTDQSITWTNKIFITKSVPPVVVCSGRQKDPENPFSTFPMIRILLLSSGLHLTDIRDPEIEDEDKITVIGERIFAKCKQEIHEWNLEGILQKPIPAYSFSTNTNFTDFYKNQGSLVTQDPKFISLYDLETGIDTFIDLRKSNIEITRLFIEHQRLIAGLDRGFGSGNNACFVINTANRKYKHVRAKNAFLHQEKNVYTNIMEWREDGYISAPIETWKGLTYFSDNTGIVVAIDLNTGLHQVIGKHSSAIYYASREGRFLATASTDEVNIWDLETHALLRYIRCKDVISIFLKDGKLLVSDEASLITIDFLMSEKGEHLTAHSSVEV